MTQVILKNKSCGCEKVFPFCDNLKTTENICYFDAHNSNSTNDYTRHCIVNLDQWEVITNG